MLFQNIFALQFLTRVFFFFSLKFTFKSIFNEQVQNRG